jgi:hypothetical protein
MTDDTEITWKDWLRGASRSKTIVFAVLLAVASTLEGQIGLFREHLDPATVQIVGTLVSVAVAVLRVLTTAPLPHK